jgi:hypothetical protein
VTRGLTGDFGTMPLKDLVSYLGNRRASGALHLDRGAVQKQVWIQDGMVVSASSNQPREYLGQFLINMGHLSEDQFIKAYQTQKETKVFLGKILVMIGLVSEEVVLNALGLKMRETLMEGFLWEDGTFVFDPTERPPAFEGLEVKVDLLDIHREGEFRETAWQAIRSVFPHGKVRLEVNEARFPAPPPGSLDEKLLALIRERHRIEDMLLTLHANDFFVYQRLYALYRQDAVRVDDLGDAGTGGGGEAEDEEMLVGNEVVGEEQSPAEIAGHALMFLEAGNLADAEALARRAYEMAPTPEMADTLRRCERALGDQLRQRFLSGNQVPTLLVPPSQLKTMSLSAPEKYLLSRIDGGRDVLSIVSVSPLQELEALKLFQRFLDTELIRLG